MDALSLQVASVTEPQIVVGGDFLDDGFDQGRQLPVLCDAWPCGLGIIQVLQRLRQ